MSPIITFYSYKGGTGRSMALANVVWILASQGKRVLMVDWDLEAPGLHRYFHPFIYDPALKSTEGLIDLLARFQDAAVRPASESSTQDPDSAATWYLPLAKLDRYVLPLAWHFGRGGALDLLPAGRQDSAYAARVNAFDWASFYDRLGGGVFIEALKAEMARNYDYVLVDSRTGLSDTAGICSVQLPDILIICFTLNLQSIEGAAAVAASTWAQRCQARDRAQPLQIFPVPMRIELNGDRHRREQRASSPDALSTAFSTTCRTAATTVTGAKSASPTTPPMPMKKLSPPSSTLQTS